VLYLTIHLQWGYPEGYFGGNPLSPSSIGLSPLHAGHPSGYTSTGCGPRPIGRLASPCPRVDHIGFGSDESDLWHFRTTCLALSGCAASLSLRLSAHHFHQLLGSCFKKNDATLLNLPSLYIFLHIASRRPHSFRAAPSVATQFQALLTPLSGCFSAFARATCALSVSGYI